MKKILSFLAFLFAFAGNSSFAQTAPTYNWVIPIAFHGPNSTNVSSNLYSFVCQLNANFAAIVNAPYAATGVKITFYVHTIDLSNPPLGGNFVHDGAINVYHYSGLNGDGYDPNNDWIKLGAFDGSSTYAAVLTHEVGHYLGLLHPEGNNMSAAGCNFGGCSSSTGDADCCPHTPPAINSGNWMNQGNYTGFFTDDQATRMYANCVCRWGAQPPANNALNYNSNYYVPAPVLTPTGSLYFYHGACGVAPTSIVLEIRTGCSSGSNEAWSTITLPASALDLMTNITLTHGISYINYHFWYNSYEFVRRINYNYNAYPYDAGCTIGNPNSRLINGTELVAGTNSESAVNIFVEGSFLKYTNSGFEHVEVYDMAGRVAFTGNLPEGTGALDISSFASGIYVFKASSLKGEVKVLKFNK